MTIDTQVNLVHSLIAFWLNDLRFLHMADHQIIVDDSVGPIDHAVISELATQQGTYPQGLANAVTPPARGVKRKSGVSGGERGTHGKRNIQ